MADADARDRAVPAGGGGRGREPEFDRLSNIIKEFNDLFGNIAWNDADKIQQGDHRGNPEAGSADKAYQNAKQNSGKQNAKLEHDKALARVVLGLVGGSHRAFKQFSDNPNFKRWLTDVVFESTYRSDRPST